LSKNDYGFTLFVFRVNEKYAIGSFEFSMECSWFTGGCSIFGAAFCVTGFCDVRPGAILAERLYTTRLSGCESTFWSL
jgi:hypothetical protein